MEEIESLFNLSVGFEDKERKEIAKKMKDSTQLLAIFPEEIWIRISEKITDPDDIENFLNSSLYFRDLLFEKRIHLLFPKVWSILGVRYHQHEYLRQAYLRRNGNINFPPNSLIRCESCGKIRQSRWFSEILNCRLVCGKWCDTIDKFYAELPAILLEPNMFEMTCEWLSNRFNPANMRAIVQHFRDTHAASEDGKFKRNPFVERIFDMYFSYNIQNDNLLNEVTHFLQTFGEHIWHSEITVNSANASWILCYTFLRKILLFLPNLKTAELEEYWNGEQEINMLPPDTQLQLKREIGLNPLSKLRNLKSVTTKNLSAPVFEELIRKNNHITDLATRHGYTLNPECTLFREHLPKLKKLAIDIFTDQVLIALENIESKFPLEEMDMNFEHFPNLEWRRVFSVLEREWGTTLKSLKLKITTTRVPHDKAKPYSMVSEEEEAIWSQSSSLRLNLPRLSQLILDIPKWSSLDFILPMKNSLEYVATTTDHFTVERYLQKRCIMKHEEGHYEYVEWSTRNLNASNVWIIFTKLKQIKVYTKIPWRHCTWTRDDWDAKRFIYYNDIY